MLWVVSTVALLCSLLACWLAVTARRTSENRASTKWKAEAAALRQELTELLDLVEQIQSTMKKRGARNANAARWGDGEPDPQRDPEAWKKWANAGGLRQYLQRGR